MGLIHLKTNLKSLKYGKDRFGGGSSNQPYITKPIPDGISSLDNFNNDFILRGGILSVTRTADDVSRLTQMLFDTKSPNGLLFTVKQNLLSRIGVRTEAGGQEVYLPTSTIAQAGVNAFGLHLYKQGINPFPDFNVGGINIDLPGNIKTYSQIAKANNQPFIVNNDEISTTSFLPTNFNEAYETGDLGGLGVINSVTRIRGQANRLLNLYDKNIILSSNSPTLLSYQGGPGSILGIGKTHIYFADKRIVTLNKPIKDANYLVVGINTIADDLSNINDSRTTPTFTPKIIDFRNILRKSIINKKSSIISNSPDYLTANIENRVSLGDPGRRGNIISYTSGKKDDNGKSLGPLDKINSKQLYSSRVVDLENTNDLVKFRIEAINNNDPGESVFIHFRALINSFSDAYNATWNVTKYLGRGEEFYTYGGFTRNISMGWTISAQSKEELIPMYQKLNYLASNLAPDYSENGYMRGSMMRLTVGGYLYSQPGFINSLVYDIDEQTPWEIGINDVAGGNPSDLSSTNNISDKSVKELPHILKVTMNFTPIMEFVPRKQQNLYDGIPAGKGKYISTWGKEKYIALSTGDHNNYDGGKDEEFTYIPK